MNEYINLVGTDEVKEPDSVYQERLKEFNLDFLLDTFFSNYKSSISILDVGNTHDSVFSIQREDGSVIYFSFQCMKNSGIVGNTNKRYQVYSGYWGQRSTFKNRKPEDTYFFLGLYPTGDKTNPICVLMDNDGVTYNPTSYSSCWIKFEALKIALTKGVFYSFNSDDFLKYICFTKNFVTEVMEAILKNDFTNLIDRTGEIDFNGAKVPKIDVKDFNKDVDLYDTESEQRIRRNSNLRDLVIVQSGYTCSLCGKTETFCNTSNVQYFEAHHLIPCNPTVQRKFAKKLDSLINMFCLCPECHRKIHYIKRDLLPNCLDILYTKRKDELKQIYNLEFEDLLEIYRNER